jgi:hypothetical protein
MFPDKPVDEIEHKIIEALHGAGTESLALASRHDRIAMNIAPFAPYLFLGLLFGLLLLAMWILG